MTEKEHEFDFASWPGWAKGFELLTLNNDASYWQRRFKEERIDNQLAEDYRNVIFDL